MDALIDRNRQHFTAKWGRALRDHMPPCEMANACTQPHKTMYTHLAATRMYTYRMLWLDMILPEPDRDSGSVRTPSTPGSSATPNPGAKPARNPKPSPEPSQVRTLVILKILLALRVHVSIVTVQRSGKGRHERCAS